MVEHIVQLEKKAAQGQKNKHCVDTPKSIPVPTVNEQSRVCINH